MTLELIKFCEIDMIVLVLKESIREIWFQDRHWETHAGRYLKVIYVFDLESKNIFVITAFDLIGKSLMAHKRRMKK